MKRFFISIIFALLTGVMLLCLFACGAQKGRVEVHGDCLFRGYAEQEYDRRGNIIKAYFYASRYSDDVIEWEEYDYNKDGQITQYTVYNADGTIEKRQKYEYHNGNKIKFTTYGADEKLSGWYEYSYDANDNLTESVYHDANGYIIGRVQNEYDETGNLIEHVKYTVWHPKRDPVETIHERVKYEYDADSNLLKATTYNGNGDKISEEKYAGKEYRIEYVSFTEQGEKYEWDRWEYDEHGNVIRQVVSYPTGARSYQCIESVYDDNNNCISRINLNEDGSISERANWEYDDDGNIIKSEQYDGNGELTGIYESEYYKNGELRSRTSYNENKVKTDYDEYYENGDYKKEIRYTENGDVLYAKEYFRYRHIVVSVVFGENGTVSTVYFGNDKNTEGIEIQYDAWGKIKQVEHKLNKLTNQLSQTLYLNSDEKITAWDRYQYDDKGYLIKRLCYEPYGSGERLVAWHEYKYSYDKIYGYRRAKETKYLADGTVEYWTDYKKDDAGEIIYYNADGSIK